MTQQPQQPLAARVERLAKMAWEKFFERFGWASLHVSWDTVPDQEKEHWRFVVRAILEARCD